MEQIIREEKFFLLLTLDLLAIYSILVFELLGLDGKTKKTFLFKRTSGLDEAIQIFWKKKLELNLKKFSLTIKSLKSRLYDME